MLNVYAIVTLEGDPGEASLEGLAREAREISATYQVTAVLLPPVTAGRSRLLISGPRAHVKAALIKRWGLEPRKADDRLTDLEDLEDLDVEDLEP